MMPFLLLLVTSTTVAAGPRADADTLARWADAEFLPALAEHRASGLVMTVVRQGEVVFSRGYGQADVQAGRPVRPDETLFRIGSATKVFTATAVAQLLERGRIASLDDPANRYLQGLQLPLSGGREITIWDLLTHRAGFEDSAYGLGAALPPARQPPAVEEARRLMPALVRPAGSASVYSNYSTALLGLLVEQVSGRTMAQYMAEHIFAPLQMTRSRLSDDFEPDPALGVPAASLPDGTWQPLRYLPMRRFIAPAGGIVTTGADMARFMAAQIDGAQGRDTPILKAATAALMQQRKAGNHPAVSGFGMKFMVQPWNGHRVIEHGGGWPGFSTVMLMLPDDGIGIFISIMGGDAEVGLGERLASLVTQNRLTPRPDHTVKGALNPLAVREDLLEHLLGPWTAPAPPVAAAVPAGANLSAYAGSYWRQRRSYTGFEAFFDLLSPRAAILNVQPGTAGALRINGVDGFMPVAPGVFHNPQARPRFEGDPLTQAVYAFTLPAGREGSEGRAQAVAPLLSVDQWLRTSSLANPATLAPLLLLAAAGGLSALLLPFWPAVTRGERLARWLPLLQWLLLLGVPLVLLAGYGEAEGIVHHLLPGVPGRFVVLLLLANLAVLVALATAVMAWWAWRQAAWGQGWRAVLRRVHYSLLALLGLTVAAIFVFFKLAGVHWPWH